MILISHRGNLAGPSQENENKPEQIELVLESGYDCEIDVWRTDGQLFLGHDAPTYAIDEIFLQKHKTNLWCHAKNLEALEWLVQNDYQAFSHDKDDYTLTSKNVIWAYPGQPLSNKTVCVLPEQALDKYPKKEFMSAYGICTDFVHTFEDILKDHEIPAGPRVAIFFVGRIKSYEDSYPWLKDIIIKHNADVFCSINGECDDYHKKFLEDMDVKASHFENYVCPETLLNVPYRRQETNVYNTCSMFYNIDKVMGLIEEYQKNNNFTYDIVVYARADILTEQTLTFQRNATGTVFIPFGYDYGGVNDQFAYGDFESMKYYAQCYQMINTYCYINNIIFHPESILRYHLETGNMTIKRFPWNYTLNNKRF
jgi:hypothetical protein